MTSHPGRDGNPLDQIEYHQTDLDNEKHTVPVNMRESSLDKLKADGYIEEYQYKAGIQFRQDWEIASIGPLRAPDLERLPQGIWSDLSMVQAEGLSRLNSALQRQNARGRRMIVGVCAEARTFSEMGRLLGVSRHYIAERFREAIDDLAEHYGLKENA